jgi:hypothetical protein
MRHLCRNETMVELAETESEIIKDSLVSLLEADHADYKQFCAKRAAGVQGVQRERVSYEKKLEQITSGPLRSIGTKYRRFFFTKDAPFSMCLVLRALRSHAIEGGLLKVDFVRHFYDTSGGVRL